MFVDKFHEVKVGYDLNMSVTKWHEYLRDRRLIKVNYVYCIDILLAETDFLRNRKWGMNSDFFMKPLIWTLIVETNCKT